MTKEPIPLMSPDGRIFGYACPRCLHVRASTSTSEFNDRVEASKEDAASCCLCRDCGKEIGTWKGIQCDECRAKARAKHESSPQYLAYLAATAKARETFDQSPSPESAHLLARLMSDISEEHWAAGWMSGLEFALWDMVQGGSRRYGMDDVSDSEVAQLELLSELADGWVIHGDGGEQYVPLEIWVAKAQAQYAKRAK